MLSFAPLDWTSEFSDLADTFRLGRVRSRHKCSADFRSVPARFNAKVGRLGRSDVSVQKLLHGRSFDCSIELLRDAMA
jgi:hypothetical protein